MEIKSIVNQGVPNIKSCESEPIHIPGSIQPHGYLLAVDSAAMTIKFCSANIQDLLGLTPEMLLETAVDRLDPQLLSALHNFNQERNQQHPVVINLASGTYDLMFRDNGALIVLEFESHGNTVLEEHSLFDQTREFTLAIENARSLQELCQQIADSTRALTGYDRVMIYRFDKSYNGEVYAESKREGLEPFLNLHYPHSDIPPQARDLYIKNHLRIIVDVSYQPVAILTRSGSTHQDLDLSEVRLRSVSPIHIQYLKNMNVGATLTISLVQDGKLWGLIACHHGTAKFLSYRQRQSALLQGHFLSSQIKVRQVAEEYEVNVGVEAHLQQVLTRLNADGEFDQKFEQFTSLLAVTNSSGCIILTNGKIYEKGLVPPRPKTMDLIRWIDKNIRSTQYATSFLSGRYPGAESISRSASGIFYHALGKPTESCVIWFREEVVQTINWAGNPATAVQQDAVTKSLTPRSSFDLFREQVRHHSQEWRVSEINAAIRFAFALQNSFHLDHLQHEEYRLRVLNDKLQKANHELANINWITSHDLKEPVRKIQIFASRIMNEEEKQLSEQIRKSVEKIQKSATRMQSLVEDIVAYSLTSQTSQSLVPTDLNAIVEEVKDEIAMEIEQREATIDSFLLPPDVPAVPSQMHQLFLNLISNSLKFSRPGVPPKVEVRCSRVLGKTVQEVFLPEDQYYYRIEITDNGIGFDPLQKENLFHVFYRLHSKEAYPGTGIGLSICKKIMEHHRGEIVAEGVQGEGATFMLFLPVKQNKG